MLYTIYKRFPAGIDGPEGEVESFSALAALEQFAKQTGIAEYSVETGPGAVAICPAGARYTLYTYIEPPDPPKTIFDLPIAEWALQGDARDTER